MKKNQPIPIVSTVSGTTDTLGEPSLSPMHDPYPQILLQWSRLILISTNPWCQSNILINIYRHIATESHIIWSIWYAHFTYTYNSYTLFKPCLKHGIHTVWKTLKSMEFRIAFFKVWKSMKFVGFYLKVLKRHGICLIYI